MAKWLLSKTQRTRKTKLLELLAKDHFAFISTAIKTKVPFTSERNRSFRFSDVHSYNYNLLKDAYAIDGELNASLIENPDGNDFIAMEYPTSATISTASDLLVKSKCGLVISLIGDHPPWESDFLSLSHKRKSVFTPEEFMEYAHKKGANTSSISAEYEDIYRIIKEESSSFIIERHEALKDPSEELFRIKCMCWVDKTPPTTNIIKVLDILLGIWKLVHISESPVIVHCLAGVGRTGTFIFYSMLKRALLNGTVLQDKESLMASFVELFLYLRSRRTWMVENKDQLFFLYKIFIREAVHNTPSSTPN
ncbi:hypothetical protein NEAUS05_1013 [Nematocida ausubeli]|nr:hypothetical protein NEAUS05_1013 [Nematocida ausubeli]